MDVLHHWFSFVCGQNNCWYVAGQSLPMCQRCTGLYVGATCALVCWAVFRPKPTSRMLWAHGAFLLTMIPFGYHLLPQNGDIRTITGWLFSFGLVYYMAIFVASVRQRGRASMSNWAAARNVFIYFSSVVSGLAALLIALHFGSGWVARFCSALAAAGFLTLVTLAMLTIATLARGASRRFSHV